MSVRIYVGSHYFSFNSTRVVIGHRANRHAHLTLFFEPLIERGCRVWTPHITRTEFGRRHETRLATVTEAALVAWSEKLQVNLALAFRAAVRSVDLAQLEAAGWRAWVPDDSLLDHLAPVFRLSSKQFKLNSSRVDEASTMLARECDRSLVGPTQLQPAMCAEHPAGLFGPSGEGAWLFHYPARTFSEHAGWYMLPSNLELVAVVARSLEPSALAVFEKIRAFLEKG